MRALESPLYLITDRHQTKGRDLLWVLEQALDGGVKAIQLREKDLTGRELLVLAEKARALCARYRAAFFVNDRIDVALAVEAQGVQLGKASLPLSAARALLGEQRLIGFSAHSLDETREAAANGADFVLFGPVYATPSKAAYGPPQGLDALKEVVAKSAIPVYAIGGIKLENIEAIRNAGARGIALISAVLSAHDPKSAAASLLSRCG
ncbi:MAG TPA: thiamine phosphate synthase [Candidatus Eisenbacteria bacterium]|nr:thiamine phosphate synthase [Candidatus Eisenbacteria bacterium]